MRLIDADAFIEYLGLDAEGAREMNLAEAVSLEDFDRQPTAYDVARVKGQLEEKAKSYDDPASSDDGFRRFCRGVAAGFRYAMGVVVGGGLKGRIRHSYSCTGATRRGGGFCIGQSDSTGLHRRL